MELLSIIFAGVSALAAVISAIAALIAKSEVKKLKIQISDNSNRSVTGKSNVKIEGNDNNLGVVTGVNTGDINVRKER